MSARHPQTGLRGVVVCLVVAVGLFGAALFRHLSYPLLWQDEAETAVFAGRILEYGYPKVHGDRNVVYEFGPNIALGVKESIDAYIGTTWGHFYYAVPGVAWADATDDPYAKTLRMRLPFALLGGLGLLGFVWAVWPALRDDPARGLALAASFVALSALSVSLILHLREVRYYSLLVALVAALLGAHLRFSIFRSLSARSHALVVGALLAAVFHTFFSAWFSLVSLLALDALWAMRRAGPAERRRLALGFLAPVVASLLVVAPSALFFETYSVVTGFAAHLGITPAGYAANLREVLVHLARQELLLPVLALRGVHWLAARRSAADAAERPTALRIADSLSLFAAGYVAIGCLNPLVYERYFVILGPVLTLVFLLDAFELAAPSTEVVVPVRGESRRRRRARMCGLALGLVLVALSLRLSELSGRLEELRVPYQGPVDFAVEYLRETYADPASLVIATNYAAHTYMQYLGSHVIVGLSLNNIAADRRLEPDIVIPRRRWPPGRAELARFLRRGDYRAVRLPVEDRHFNNVPAVSPTRSIPDPHRFRTPHTSDPDAQLVLYERARALRGR